MNIELQNLASQYFDIEATILNKISSLPEYGRECNCEERTPFIIDDCCDSIGYCLNCGGRT